MAINRVANEIFTGIINGSRAYLSRGITLVESLKNNEVKRDLVRLAFKYHRENVSSNDTLRIAITGAPGAGKSSFIETLGLHLVKKESRKVAVLAIDPSSALTGGSILADKTRMNNLSKDPNAYIRPSPNRGHEGGVTRSTYEAILLCEACGYDTVMIETVGVGQSEYQVRNLCDIFALLVAPSGGDDIQAIKKGIFELANLIVVTKSDTDLVKHARHMSADILSAVKFFAAGKRPIVKRCSAHSGEGVEDVWKAIMEIALLDPEVKKQRRRDQRVMLLKNYLINAILDRLEQQASLKDYERRLREDDSVFIFDLIDDLLNKITI